jgi:hypothetical protein
MIKTPFKNRFRDRKANAPQGHRSQRDFGGRREGTQRREHSTVVHPWMSLPEKLAATQAAMHELAGETAFQCPAREHYRAPADEQPRPRGVNIVFRKRRIPVSSTPELAGAS